MARPRIELQKILENIMGNRNVYFQPPETVKLKYPCIVYNRSDIDIVHADNTVYKTKNLYSLMLMDRNPDSEYTDKLSSLPYCNFDRHYAADNVNHDIFTIYF